MRVLPLSVAPLSVALAMVLALPATAQDISDDAHNGGLPEGTTIDGQWGHGHAENHDWYKTLKQPGTGYSCCSGDVAHGDCRPTRAYKMSDGTWRALVDGHWETVPPGVVLKTMAPDGNSHVCAGKSGMIFCFIGGVPKS